MKTTLWAARIFSAVWVTVELFTVWAAGFGGGPLVSVVANADGLADVHTQRFAALLVAMLLLNVYAIVMGTVTKEQEDYKTLVHTILVGDALAIFSCGIVECLHGDLLAIGWHAMLMFVLVWLLIARREDWRSASFSSDAKLKSL